MADIEQVTFMGFILDTCRMKFPISFLNTTRIKKLVELTSGELSWQNKIHRIVFFPFCITNSTLYFYLVVGIITTCITLLIFDFFSRQWDFCFWKYTEIQKLGNSSFNNDGTPFYWPFIYKKLRLVIYFPYRKCKGLWVVYKEAQRLSQVGVITGRMSH